jgi:hypothetical protein
VENVNPEDEEEKKEEKEEKKEEEEAAQVQRRKFKQVATKRDKGYKKDSCTKYNGGYTKQNQNAQNHTKKN